MTSDHTKRYDSFVVRVWRETASGRLLRAEVDHVQSGAVYVARNLGLTWFQDTLRSALDADTAESDQEVDSPRPPHLLPSPCRSGEKGAGG
jgi:hypothetical protein